jgi:hypothetical protein
MVNTGDPRQTADRDFNELTPTVNATCGSVVLRGFTVSLDSEVGAEFATDCARYTEGLLSEDEIKGKWAIPDEDWEGLTANIQLLSAIRAERERRTQNGEAAREMAQKYFAKAPTVLGSILTDEQISPRNRIEAAKELRQAAGNRPDFGSGPREKIIISIDLGDDYKLYRQVEAPADKPSKSVEEEIS